MSLLAEWMTASIALDTNILAFLIEAIHDGYDPSADPDEAQAAERVAAFRILVYRGGLAVGPTVREEIEATPDPEFPGKLRRLRAVLPIVFRQVDARLAEARARALQHHHPAARDC